LAHKFTFKVQWTCIVVLSPLWQFIVFEPCVRTRDDSLTHISVQVQSWINITSWYCFILYFSFFHFLWISFARKQSR